jgi:hypothetical protein
MRAGRIREGKTIMSDENNNQQGRMIHIDEWLASQKRCPECGARMRCGYMTMATSADDTGYWRCKEFECGHFGEWELLEDESDKLQSG